MDAFEATSIIVKAAIENKIVACRVNTLSKDDETYIEINNFNAERVADFVKTVYNALIDE